jgi:hypothetical protein
MLERRWRRMREAGGDLRATRRAAEQLVGQVAELQRRLADTERAVTQLGDRVAAFDARSEAEYDRQMRALRMVRDDDARAWERLWQLRGSEEYELAYTEPEPLVTFFIPTWRNWRQLAERAIPSVLAQTYENWECLIVGDAAPPEAADAIESFHEPRIRYVNMPHRGPYPEAREDAWFISGTFPFNTGLGLMRGRWHAGLADDDAVAPRFAETMLALARRERAEVAYGQLRQHHPDRPAELIGEFPPRHGHWGIQGSLVHGGLRFLPLLPSDWVFSVPNDWSWAERMLRIGVRFAMSDEVTAEYFPSREWTDRPTPS